MNKHYDALALFSGGLDSVLACKTIQDQGLSVLGLHFISPFFGKPHLLERWSRVYGVEIVPVDVSEKYVEMLRDPANGYGKQVNPCIDCKILMLSHARTLLPQYGAKFLISGEVVGQRPMSQRRDTLNQIRNTAEVKDVLLRPLCALKLEPTPVEESGLVDRERLLDIGGRGRKRQLELARGKYGFKEIPTPGGGCLLTETESAGRFFQVLKHHPAPGLSDFRLSNQGRQLWAGDHWLAVGRNKDDNDRLRELAAPADYLFDVVGFPGPVGLGRPMPGRAWSPEAVSDAAAFVASYSPKAVASGRPVRVAAMRGPNRREIVVAPCRETPLGWAEPDTEGLKEWKVERAGLRNPLS
ncbi:adenine nucleotide alpha hydrolase family protein [Paucidesulfovibrio longus]|uniref:thiamine biosynthesis protein n=1 Tax=Paucidesulfovibrio longus TaxID=889 RepID=UPI0003B72500|nr:thiamine biosynthesis protein [Paucidesulfovibrio longus]